MTLLKKIKTIFKEKRKVIILFSLCFFLLGSFLATRTFSNEKEPLPEEDVVKDSYPVFVAEDKSEGPALEVAAALSVYINEEDQKELYEENANTPLPIASISKLMTALVVMENYDLNSSVGVTERDIVTRTEFRDFRAFRETTVEEMIYPMVIESNNSAAFALALISDRFFSNSSDDPVDDFVKEMNRKAQEIKLTNTNFINPSGLDGRGDYNISTSRDIVKFANYLLTNTDIFEITKKPSYNLYSPDKTIYYQSLNTNDFLHKEKNAWEKSIVGGKTGWTHAAFGCLLLVLEAPDEEGYIVNVVLGAEDRFLEMEKLVNYVYESYEF